MSGVTVQTIIASTSDAAIPRCSSVARAASNVFVGRLKSRDVQTLKRVTAAAKADGTVTPEEADQILVEMERIVERYRR